MRLSAAITELTASWETILNQLGLPIRILPGNSSVDPGEYPLIILTKKSASGNVIKEYLKNGGTVITEADIAASILGIKTRSVYLKYLLVRNDDVFNIEGICDINKRCLVAAGSNHLESDKGFNTILAGGLGGGTVVILPSGFISLLNDDRIARKNFFSPYAKKRD